MSFSFLSQKDKSISFGNYNLLDMKLYKPVLMMERLLEEAELQEVIVVKLFDKYGNSFHGRLVKIDHDQNVVLLAIEESKNLILNCIDLESISSVEMCEAHKLLKLLIGYEKLEAESQTQEKSVEFDLPVYLEQMKEALLETMGRRIQVDLILDKKNPSSLELQNARSLLDSLQENLFRIMRDEFGKELLSGIDHIELQNTKEVSFQIKKRNSKLLLTWDFGVKLPAKIAQMMKDSLERAL